MNESAEYILINTPELKALYSPQRAGDEYWSGTKWERVAYADSFYAGDSYRRARSLAWLPIAAHPVSYPAWVRREDFIVWADSARHIPCGHFTHWQPAPAAPQPPPAPIDPSRGV